MELPQHWVTADGFSPHLGTDGGTLTVWGWSSVSQADAAGVAHERLASALERVAREGRLPSGHGYYPRVPLREPVLEEVEAASGAVIGLVTRNRMGCEVLCTDLLLIADVDVPELEDLTPRRPWPGADAGAGAAARGRRWARGFLRRLLTGDPAPTPMAPAEPAEPASSDAVPAVPRPGDTSVAESLACEPVWEFARRHPELGVRVYRTAAGLRVLVTGSGAAPDSARARELLTELGSDPLYVELCATHHCYRARLTPKPFRVGARAPRASWPFADRSAEEAFAEWVAGYDARSSGFSVCRLVSASGPAPGAVEQQLVTVHDARCRVAQRLPLA